ncbi:c-type cytochrome [Maribacter algarum]|uniref:C-type cytochrome n=1 Tax=Maribacter algarum (ex Zhang et al. 2020) TaxID=2578118 RepID=A0A5S3PPQ6_9FLAO|nr:PQQ-dependent sugar dehydrogenase [Maribacter algarum]TMM56726.1 c-type cytochrome [Maribacter algarum]
MNKAIHKVTILLCITAMALGSVFMSCESSKSEERPEFEKPKFIIQLEKTRLLVSEVVRNLDEPWEITWGGDDHLWFTEKKGNVLRMNPNTGQVKKVLNVPNVYSEGNTPGLLGLVLGPDFKNEPYVYMHYTYIDSSITDQFDRRGSPNFVRSKVERYTYFQKEDTLKEPELILPKIPGFRAHNGSRLAISEDDKLLFTIGDVGNSENAQTIQSLPGKVLRMNLDGSVPKDNPIAGSYFYSMGHRNSQGLVAANGKIYSSEHGPNNDDEINIIEPGGNYGWPFVEGYCDKENEMAFCDSVKVTEPIYDWTPTIAPAGLDFYANAAIPEWKNNLMLATLKGQALWLFELDDSGEKIVEERVYLQKQFGRIRDLCISSTGEVYLITSNTDWNVSRYNWLYGDIPKDGNDRVLKIAVIQEDENDKYDHLMTFVEDSEPERMLIQYGRAGLSDVPGAYTFSNNCAPCHVNTGIGIPEFTPPLLGTATVANKQKLIATTLFGLSGEIEVKGKKYNDVMPGFAAGLTNQELKDLLNYVRTSLNTHKDSITISEIEEIRKGRSF